ncbi:ABC transporter substrate-binding protein [Streptomyces sp. NPDC002454]|uniref:ABC transporter substrate-binding protein n=1 Tax=Streptomyces sp. NPDC002490 TaxID=3154416 RepID=UPI0033330271
MAKRSLSLLAAAVFLISGCGSGGGDDGKDRAAGDAPEGFPVTLTNCGVKTTYERPPKRAVTLNQHVTEILLALGLEKSMVGTAYLDDEILPEYAEAYRGIEVISDEYPSFENILAAEPDFAYAGFSSAFDEKEGRGREALAKAGVNSYVNVEECPPGPMSMELIETELRTLGKVFGVPDRADREIEKVRTALKDVEEKLGDTEPVEVFVYDSGDKTAFTAGGAGIGNEMIEQAGGQNVFADLDKQFGDVSFEQVAERAPEAIVIYDYGDTSVAQKKKFLLANPALKDVPAIKNERFAVLPLSSTVLGVRVPAGVDGLARQLHPARFR